MKIYRNQIYPKVDIPKVDLLTLLFRMLWRIETFKRRMAYLQNRFAAFSCRRFNGAPPFSRKPQTKSRQIAAERLDTAHRAVSENELSNRTQWI